jgi:hypothetical protein
MWRVAGPQRPPEFPAKASGQAADAQRRPARYRYGRKRERPPGALHRPELCAHSDICIIRFQRG